MVGYFAAQHAGGAWLWLLLPVKGNAAFLSRGMCDGGLCKAWNALKGGQGLASHCLLSSGERPRLESSMRASLSALQSTPSPWGVGVGWG